MARFADFTALSAFLDSRGMFSMDLSLARMEQFLVRAELTRLPCPTVHVVGTNGKGSVSACLDSLARAHGVASGLYTSPHFLSFRERVRVGGAMLSEDDWVGLGNAVEALGADLGLTYFEWLTALGLVAFARAGVGVAILEAGLGGTYDAVSALATDLTVFTPIGLDHEKVLGPTIAAIARDKAGAMKPGSVAVTGVQEPEVLDILREAAQARRVTLHLAADLVPEAPPASALGLAGAHQRENARLALAAWRILARLRGLPDAPESEARGLAGAFIPGRLQRVPGNILLDGAHNAHALRALAAALDGLGVRPRAVVFGCMADKDVPSMAPLVLGLTDGPVLACGIPDCERAMAPDVLAAALGPRAEAVSDIAEALARAAEIPGDGPLLVCGSLYLLASFYTKHPESLERLA